jgi:hypothetical protein
VDPRVGLEEAERRKILPLPGLELRPIGRPARTQSLYRLRYPLSEGLKHGVDAQWVIDGRGAKTGSKPPPY